MSEDFLDTVRTKDAAEIRYCYEDGVSPLVTREEHESALNDAQCRADHASRVHAAELHEAEKRAKALDAENAELRRQVNVAESVLRYLTGLIGEGAIGDNERLAALRAFAKAAG
jgi:hypothetical protein